MGPMCLVCHDPHHFQMKVDDCRRIANSLSRYISGEINVDTCSELWRHLIYDEQHVKVMCGQCPKVDKHNLKREEEQLRKTVYQICMQLENGEKLPVHEILPLLAGYYPIMHREVHKRTRRM